MAADAAYSDGPIRAGLQGDGKTPEIVAYIPEPRPKSSGDGKFTANQFVYDGEKKTVTCPGGGGFGEREREQEEGWFQLLFSKGDVCGVSIAGAVFKQERVGGGREAWTDGVYQRLPIIA